MGRLGRELAPVLITYYIVWYVLALVQTKTKPIP